MAERILYSADAAALTGFESATPPEAQTSLQASLTHEPEQTDAKHLNSDAWTLVVFDENLPDLDTLIADVEAQAAAGNQVEYLILGTDSDGVSLIASTLEASGNEYQSVQLYTHGETASFELGANHINSTTLPDHMENLARWSSFLSPGADILIFACDLAANEEGASLIAEIADVTGAEVAASIDATGYAPAGGDWDLEAETGLVEATTSLSATARSTWIGTFDAALQSGTTQVNETTSGAQQLLQASRSTQIATNGTTVVIVWEDETLDSIHFRLYDPDGNPLSGEQDVSGTNNAERRSPSVAMNANGEFIIVWTSSDQDGDDEGIYAQRFNADGTPVVRPATALPASGNGGTYENTFEFRVNQSSSGVQDQASVGLFDNGRFIVTWRDDQNGGTELIRYATFAADGSREQASEQTASRITNRTHLTPVVAIDNTSQKAAIAFTRLEQYVVVFSTVYLGEIDLTTVNANGTTENSIEVLPTNYFAISHYTPAIAMNDDGKIAVVSGNNYGYVNFRSYNSDLSNATGFEESILVTPDDNDREGSQSNPSIALDEFGNIAIAWDSDNEIRLRQYNAIGEPYGDVVQANSYSAGDQYAPQIALNGSDVFLAYSGASSRDAEGISLTRTSIEPVALNVEFPDGQSTQENGVPVEFLVSLASAPKKAVHFSAAINSSDEATLSNSTHTFNDSNWSTPISVLVVPADDSDADGNQDFTITLSTSGSPDDNYDAMPDVLIDWSNLDDEVPVGPVTDGDGNANAILESASGGASTGVTASAVDPSSADTVTYSLLSDAGGLFAIPDSSSGVVLTSASARFDYETATEHTIRVEAKSSDGTTSEADFLIQVIDINESIGTIEDLESTTQNSVAENAVAGTTIGLTAFAQDPDDGDTVTYEIVNGSDNFELLDPTVGAVTVAAGAALNYENATDHIIRIRATSSDGSQTLRYFTIGITDAAESVSTVTDSNNSTNQIYENATAETGTGLTAYANDQDAGDSVSYSIVESTPGLFKINSNTGAVSLRVSNTLDFETDTQHTIRIRALSDDGSESEQDFVIQVLDSNEAVGAVIDKDLGANEISEDAVAGTPVNISAEAVDPDAGDTVSYSVEAHAGNHFTINDATNGVVTLSSNANLDYETAPQHTVWIQAVSSDGSTSRQQFVIDLLNANDPIASIDDIDGAANFITETSVSGDATGITAHAVDPDTGPALSYSLVDDAGGRFQIADAATGVVTVNNHTGYLLVPGSSHNITIRAVSANSTLDKVFSIAVTSTNQPISAVADTDAAPDTVTESALAGTYTGLTALASDPDGEAVSYALDSNPGNLFAIEATSGRVLVSDTASFDFNTSNTHTIVIRSESTDGSFSTASFAISVTDTDDPLSQMSDVNTAPNVVAETAATGETVGVTLYADDPDLGDTVTYSLITNPDNLFAINSTTGVITVSDPAELNFDTDAQHIVRVQAASHDATQTLKETVTRLVVINVADVNRPVGEIMLPENQPNYAEIPENIAPGTNIGIQTTAIDPDLPDNVSYAIQNDPDGLFQIGATSGVVTVGASASFDFESAAQHTFTVVATSDDGSSSSANFTVAITDVNEGLTPVIDSNSGTNTVTENSANGSDVNITALSSHPIAGQSVVYSLVDDAGGRFTIDPDTGVVTVADESLLDFEEEPEHSILVRADSATNDGITGVEESFLISVSDANDAVSALTDANQADNSIDENTPIGTGTNLTALASDQDPADDVSYSLRTNPDSLFAIDRTSGQVTLAKADVLDFETTTSYTLTIRAISDDGSFSENDFVITVNDANDPVGRVTDTNAADNTVVENSAPGTNVGITAEATDQDPTNSVEYSLSGSSAALFSIESATGVVSIAPGATLDFDTNSQHTITVVATSDDNSTSSRNFTIALTNVNEPPTAENSTATLDRTITSELTLSHFGYSDPDAGDNLLRVRIESLPSVGSLVLNGTPVSLNQVIEASQIEAGLLSYTPVENATGTPYASFGFSVVDSSGLFSTNQATLSIDVINFVDFAPRIISDGGGDSASIFLPDQTQLATTVNATDPNQDALTYSVAGGPDAQHFTIDAASGALSFIATPLAATPFDDNGDNIYELIVSVSDGLLSDEQSLRIGVGFHPDQLNAQWSGDMGILEDQTTPWSQVLSFSDPINAAAIDLRLTVSSGTLTIGQVAGLSFTEGDGLADQTMQLRGSAAQISAAIATLNYSPAENVNGTWSARAEFSDPNDPGRSTSIETAIVIAAVNDVPVVTGSHIALTEAGTDLVLDSAILSATDVEDSDAELQITLLSLPTDGVLLLNGTELSTADQISQSAWAAGNVVYRASQTGDGIDTFQVQVADSENERSSVINMSIETLPNNTGPETIDKTEGLESVTDTESGGEDQGNEGDSDTETESESSDSGAQTGRADTPAADKDSGSEGGRNEVSEFQFTDSGVNTSNSLNAEELAQSNRRNALQTLSSLDNEDDERRLIDIQLEQIDTERRFGIDQVSFSGDLFDRELQTISEEIFRHQDFDQQIVASSIAVSSTLSIGYVLWLIRSGALVSSVLASIPAWRSIDPLPVLNGMTGVDDEDDESIESMLEEAQEVSSDQEPGTSTSLSSNAVEQSS